MKKVVQEVFDEVFDKDFKENPAEWLEYHFSHPTPEDQFEIWRQYEDKQVRYGDVQAQRMYQGDIIDDIAESLKDICSQVAPIDDWNQYTKETQERIIHEVAEQAFNALDSQMRDVYNRLNLFLWRAFNH